MIRLDDSLVLRPDGKDSVVDAIHQFLLVKTICPIRGDGDKSCHPGCVNFMVKSVGDFDDVPAHDVAYCRHFKVYIGPRVSVGDDVCCECGMAKFDDEMATSGGKNNICHECTEEEEDV